MNSQFDYDGNFGKKEKEIRKQVAIEYKKVLQDRKIIQDIKFDENYNIISGDEKLDEKLNQILHNDIIASIYNTYQMCLNFKTKNYYEISIQWWNLIARFRRIIEVRKGLREFDKMFNDLISKQRDFIEYAQKVSESSNDQEDMKLLLDLQKKEISKFIYKASRYNQNLKKYYYGIIY